ncbi:MAG: tRNA epoxyqueuosine(34) reductase QueG, partial [Elusimicrobia bacterium]|nr:tRNA epoxyqueuosine(34) reductase QueG [Elusimicrobiota bacterium]
RPAVGDWAFGCDICPEVCPWNRFARPGPALGAPGESALELEPLLALDQAAFKARFQDSCLSRAKRQGLARNAALALGNGGEARHRPALQRAAVDSDPIVAEQASWSLSRLEAVRSRGG